MTQHINLLSKKKNLGAPATQLLLAPLATVLLVLLALWAKGQMDETQALKDEQSAQQALQLAKDQLAASAKASGGDLSKEIEALRPRAQAAQAVTSKFDTLGRQQGYSDYLSALASVSESGVWLSKVDVSQGGKSVSLAGRALDKAAVLRYVKKLNDRFASLGVNFSTLDITPEAVPAKAGGAAGPLAVVAFKLN